MTRALDGVLLVLLALALVQAVQLVQRGGEARVYVPLQDAQDPPGVLQAPGAAERVLAARSAAVGDFITVEDLARGALALRDGPVTGSPPLSDAERAALTTLLERAAAHRADLLAVEGEIAAAEAKLQAQAIAIAETLTAEQRAWIVAQRDRVSVGEVEQAYWDELLRIAPTGDAERSP